MSSRRIVELDYAILHRTGKRVPKVKTNMANQELQKQAINISSDIEDLMESYEIEKLTELDELDKFVTLIGDMKRDYRRIHAQLKIAEGENYHKAYPNYQNQLNELIENFKEANEKINALKRAEREKHEELEYSKRNLEHEKFIQQTEAINIKLEESKLQCKYEWDFFIRQVNREIENCDWTLVNECEEIKISIAKFESRLENFYKICSEVNVSFREKATEFEFPGKSDEFILSVREKINSGKIRIQELIKENEMRLKQKLEWDIREKELAEKIRREGELTQENKKIKDLISCADSLYFELETRYDTLKGKCSADVNKLNDYEILDLKKREEGFHMELRELIDKVSSFVKFILPCGDKVSEKRSSVIEMRESGTTFVETFLKAVRQVIEDRDISEEKLKNAAGLRIDLPKFKGYYSEMDIFTFRSEFKKLIEPYVQKKLWSDYLKKNFLSGAAYNLVAKIDCIDNIWEKLTEAYGDTKLLLQNKISSLDKFSGLEKLRDDEKIAFSLSSTLNIMTDLNKLAETYNLEGELYYGGGLHKMLELIGKSRERNFIKFTVKHNLSNKEKWLKLKEFLNEELLEREAFVLNEKTKKCLLGESLKSTLGDLKSKREDSDKNKDSKIKSFHSQGDQKEDRVCHICGKGDDHVTIINEKGKPIIEYVACQKFVDLKPRERNQNLYKKRLCAKCLKPGVIWNSSHNCDKTFTCKQKFSKNGKELICEKHVLVCGFHANEKSNKDLLEEYKKTVIKPNGKFQDFTKEVKISFFNDANEQYSESEDCSIFAFQTIKVNDDTFNLFYDSGCGDLVVDKNSILKLLEISRATQEFSGPIVLSGVGNQESICENGIYRIRLPLENGEEAQMSGVCVENITVPFPKYPLQKVEKDLRKEVAKINKDMLPNLPRLPKSVGGTVNIMIGKQYLKYFPKEVIQLETGLTLYKSRFKSVDGSMGVVSGPHPEFTKTDKLAHFSQNRKYIYLNPLVQKYNDMFTLINEVPLLGVKSELDTSKIMNLSNETFLAKRGPKSLKGFETIENTGTNISYRCNNCRNCLECKNGSLIEEISIQEDVEQAIINKSVTVDFDKRISIAKLPFTSNPEVRIFPNLKMARKVYDGQVKKLEKIPQDRLDVIESEKKLQDLGYVDYVENLSETDQEIILKNVRYFIPWRVVWSKSVSTPIRLVYDASQRCPNGCSLNDLLAKGANNMNNLVQILIRWTIRRHAFHTDIRKMYNAVQLDKSHWQYQLYLWSKNLLPSIDPKIKVIKTLIYGVKSSGNQAERAVRLTAEKNAEQYPRAHDIVLNDIYVDDCISGTDTEVERLVATDELKLSLEKGGFTLKGFSFSGSMPDEKLSVDGVFVSVGGLKWYTKEDYLMLNVNELNFARKVRGRKSEDGLGIPDRLTKRDCVGKVAELFDPLGKITPIVAGMKLDISLLHSKGLGWDDVIPEDMRKVWVSHFEMMQEIGKIKYKRAIVPEDAVSLDIETIDAGDASSKLICVAVYARFRKRDGTFSCQLVFSRSKVVPEGMSIPRAELMAAGINAATGYTVKKAFGEYHKKALKLTDSLVALHWISSKRTVLKMWVRNRVIEINRICDSSLWRYVESSKNVADLGTRKGSKILDVIEGSEWINGLDWMSKSEETFPVFSIHEVILNKRDFEESHREKIVDLGENVCNIKSFYSKKGDLTPHVDKAIKSRYEFSKYLIDPNRFRFRKVIRIMGLVLTFIKRISRNVKRIHENKIFVHQSPGSLPNILEPNGDKYIVTTGRTENVGLLTCVGGKVIELSDAMLKSAMFYFATKSSMEIKHFLSEKRYINFTTEIDGVLYYSGRILTNYSFDGYPELCEAAIDLCRTTFCVPVMDQYSPVAISIALEIHWYHPDVKHTGVESMLRQTQRVAHVIGGRDLVKSIKHGCKRCRILNKLSVDVVMGPVQNVNLCIAPAFYASQIDIFGPFKSYSNANKRATVKVWFLILCCCTTGGIDVRVMEDYSTISFIQGFIRFSCRYGYPKFLLPDEGSQLVKGCKDMNYSFIDAKQQLSSEFGVQYIPCPVGAHYVHGKVERKIRQVKSSLTVNMVNERLSIIQWETLMQQLSNSINNLPIGLKSKVEDIENLDILTPNRLILGRNNERCPNAPLVISGDHKRILESNANIFRAWFKAWLVSYVPSLIERPKWHTSNTEIKVGDVVLFLKSEQEYDMQYQYGIVCLTHNSQDGLIRRVDIEYKNHNENVRRTTQRGVRDLVIIHPVDELDIYERLDYFAKCVKK